MVSKEPAEKFPHPFIFEKIETLPLAHSYTHQKHGTKSF